MMKKNNRLYQYLIILLALGNTSIVLAADKDAVADKEKITVMPSAPAGPYRSQNTDDKNRQTKSHQQPSKMMSQTQSAQALPAPQPTPTPPQFAQRPPQQMQRPPVPEWVKNPPYGSKPPAWVINPPRQPAYGYGNGNPARNR